MGAVDVTRQPTGLGSSTIAAPCAKLPSHVVPSAPILVGCTPKPARAAPGRTRKRRARSAVRKTCPDPRTRLSSRRRRGAARHAGMAAGINPPPCSAGFFIASRVAPSKFGSWALMDEAGTQLTYAAGTPFQRCSLVRHATACSATAASSGPLTRSRAKVPCVRCAGLWRPCPWSSWG